MGIKNGSAPLADKIRPKNLTEFIGQEHLVGPPAGGGPIRKMIERGQIFSMIFWGPPGSGKTTLARIIAKSLKADYHELSAVSAGKADIKEIIKQIVLRSGPATRLPHPTILASATPIAQAAGARWGAPPRVTR